MFSTGFSRADRSGVVYRAVFFGPQLMIRASLDSADPSAQRLMVKDYADGIEAPGARKA